MEIPFISSPYGISNYKELELQANCKYFNSGILVINLEKWRTEAIDLKVMEYLVQNKDYLHHHDQEGLNVVIAGKWGELDPRWNQQTRLYKYSVWQDSPFAQDVYKNLVDHPYIIHFTGTSKPWNSYTHPFNSLFLYYVDMTPWSGWRFTVWQFFWAKLSWKVKRLKKRVLQKKLECTRRSSLFKMPGGERVNKIFQNFGTRSLYNREFKHFTNHKHHG